MLLGRFMDITNLLSRLFICRFQILVSDRRFQVGSEATGFYSTLTLCQVLS